MHSRLMCMTNAMKLDFILLSSIGGGTRLRVVLRLPSNGIYIFQKVRFAMCCTRVLDFHSSNLQITFELLIHKVATTYPEATALRPISLIVGTPIAVEP